MKRFIKKIVFLVFFMTGSFFAFSQESEEWFWNKTVTKIEFEGLKTVRNSDLTGIVSSYIDKPLTEDLYVDLLDRLYALDLFEEIEPFANHASDKNDDVLLVFNVKERPVISSVTFTGNKEIRNAELREQIKIKASDVYVQSKVLLDERTLRDYYIQKGYTQSKVSHTTEEGENGIKVIFVIDEGASTVITDIKIEGNTIASERVLKGKLQSKEVGFLRDGAFQQSVVDMDRRVIENYYHERGYIDATVIDVNVASSFNSEKNRNELTLTFKIQEGARYIFTGMTVSGNEVFSTEEIMSCLKLKEGSVYDSVKFEESLTEITSLYYESGYMSNEFYPTPSRDTLRNEVSVHLTIVENVRSHIENVIIKGNTKTKDYVIRREIPIEEGDIFSRDKIMNGLRNLYNLQYFSNIVPEPQQGSEPNLVDLVFTVEEQSTTSLQFGMTFSGVTDPNEIPISLYGKLENSNLFGEGKSISASTTISNTEQSVDLTYSQNWIGSLPVAFSTSLSFAHSTPYAQTSRILPDGTLDQYYNYMRYEGWSASLGAGVSRRWTPDFAILTLTGGASTSLKNNIYDEAMYTPTDLGVSMFANRWGLLNSVYSSFSADGRDIAYDPSRGWFASERLAWYGLIPGIEQEFFLRSDTKLEGYLTLFDIPFTDSWSLKVVLAGLTSFTALFPVKDTVLSDSNKTYIDGMFNGRGWSNAYKYTKGQAMWSSNVELRIPIVPNMIGIDFFWDAAAVKSTVSDFNSLSLQDFYFSFGPGIRFLIPQLPLHMLFTFKYRHDENGRPYLDSSDTGSPFQFVLSFNLTNR